MLKADSAVKAREKSLRKKSASERRAVLKAGVAEEQKVERAASYLRDFGVFEATVD